MDNLNRIKKDLVKMKTRAWKIVNRLIKKTIIAVITVALVFSFMPAQTAWASPTVLSAGDIVFVGLNSDGIDDFAFLLLKDITSGTQIYITDKGWDDGTGFWTDPGTGDGIVQWTTTTNISAGTVIHVKTKQVSDGPIALAEASIGSITRVNNDLVLWYGGDQLFIYQGTHSSPTFIAGIHYNVESGTNNSNWDGGANSVITSALPNQLTYGTSAIWVHSGGTERDNFIYNCSTTTETPDKLRAAINNLSNWNVDSSNTTPYTLNPYPHSFTVQPDGGTNETPSMTTNTVLTVDEGGSGSLQSKLVATDTEDDDATLTYTVTVGPSNGSLNMTTFTQAQLDAGSVSYTHDHSNTITDNFSFKVSDSEGAELTNQMFDITVNAVVDDATTLTAGDIAIVGLNSNGDMDIAFVLLKDIDADTAIYLTDRGWSNTTGFITTESEEGILQWNVTSRLTAGTVVRVVTPAGTLSVSHGSISNIATANFNISSVGDQVLIYQGLTSSPTFITGAHYNVDGTNTTEENWNSSPSGFWKSALPDPLTNGVNAIWLRDTGNVESNNFRYNGAVTSGTASELNDTINDISNWDINNDSAYTLNPYPHSFTVQFDSTAPTVDTNNVITLNEGATAYLTSSELSSSDDTTGASDITYTVTSAPANGSLNMSTFTQAQLDAGNVVSYTHDGSNTTSDSFVFAVEDSSGNEVTGQTFSITVTPSNDDPTITGLPTDITVVEDTASNVDLSAATFADSDSGSSAVTLTITTSSGTLSASSGGGVTVSGTGTSTLSLTGTAANIDTCLNTASNISYTGAANISGNDAATLTLSANDGGNTGVGGGTNVALGTVNIDITSINDEPSLTATATNPVFAEGGSAAAPFSNASASTVENGQTITGLTLTVTNVSDGSNEYLSIDGSSVALTNGNSLTTSINAINCSVSVASNTTTVTLSGGVLSTAQTQTLVNAMAYSNTSDDPTSTHNRVVTLTSLKDSGGTSGGGDDTAALSIASTVTVTPSNDDPAITGLPTDITVVEDTASNVDLSAATFTDPDSGSGAVMLTITMSSGTLSASSGGGVTVSGTGTSTLSLTGTAANIDTYLNTASNISYTGAANVSGNDAATLTLTANDGGNTGVGGGTNVALGTVNIDITSINDEPSLTATATNPVFAEGGSAAAPFSNASASTVENGQTITGLTLTVTNVSDGSNEYLSIDGSSVALTNGNSLTTSINAINCSVSVASNTATVTLSGGSLSTAQTQTLVNSMAYSNNSDDPTSTHNRVVTLTSLKDSGGTANGGDDTAALSIASTVTVTPSNDDPAITGLPTDITVVEDTASNVDLSAATFTDPDSGSGAVMLTITMSSGTLSASSGGGVTVSGTGTSTLSLTGTAANIDTYLNTASNISYTGAANVSGNDAATLTLSANDGGNTGVGGGTNVALGTVNVDITAVNDAPTISTNDGLTVDEAGSGSLQTRLVAADVDSDDNTLRFTVTAAPTHGSLSMTTFTLAQLSAGSVTYTHDGSNNASDSFTFKVSDGAKELTDQTFDITINLVDDSAPIIDVNTGLTLDEGATEVITTSELLATDMDSDDATLVYVITTIPANGQLESADDSGVAITSFTQQNLIDGKIKYVHDGSETISDSFGFKVSDAVPNELTNQTFSITVNPMPDAPTISTNDRLTLDEGDSALLQSKLIATDADSDDDSLIFTVTDAPDKGSLSMTMFTQAQIDAGIVVYIHDGSETTSDSFTFKVSDGTNELTNQTFDITINAVDDTPPTIDTNDGLTLDEGASGSLQTHLIATDTEGADANLKFTVTDLPDNGTLSLTVFTQAQIDSGNVKYTHDGSDTTSDSFTFKVADTSGNELTNQMFDVTVNLVDDAPAPTETPAPTATSAPTETPAPIATPTPTQTADATPSTTIGNVITPGVVEQDEESGTVTLEIKVSDLPIGTTSIKLQDGRVIEINEDTTIKLDIKLDDLDEKGNLSIVALDDENTPLGSYDVRVKNADGVVLMPDAGDTWNGFVSVLIWIIVGVVGIAAIGGLSYIIFKKKRKNEE